MRSFVSAVLALMGPSLCVAQASVDASCLADPDAPSAAPAIGNEMAAQFTAIRQCIADRDGDCAETALDAIDDDELNDDALAVYWLARGDMESLQGSSRRARREYRRVINQRDGNRQLAIAAIERMAIRHVEDRNYDDASDALEDLDCGEWTPELTYLRARAHFGEAQFSEAQATAQVAVNAKETAGETIPSLWRSLVTASGQRAQQAATEQVTCTRERTSNSNIPVRVCTTRAQRETEAQQAGDIMHEDSSIQVETIR